MIPPVVESDALLLTDVRSLSAGIVQLGELVQG